MEISVYIEIVVLLSGAAIFAGLTILGIRLQMDYIKLLRVEQIELWTRDFDKQSTVSTWVSIVSSIGIAVLLMIFTKDVMIVVVGFWIVNGASTMLLAGRSIKMYSANHFPEAFIRKYTLNKLMDVIAWSALMTGIAYSAFTSFNV